MVHTSTLKLNMVIQTSIQMLLKSTTTLRMDKISTHLMGLILKIKWAVRWVSNSSRLTRYRQMAVNSFVLMITEMVRHLIGTQERRMEASHRLRPKLTGGCRAISNGCAQIVNKTQEQFQATSSSTWLWTRIPSRVTTIWINRKIILAWMLERQTEVKARVWESIKVPERTLIWLLSREINNLGQSISTRTVIFTRISWKTNNNWTTILLEWVLWGMTIRKMASISSTTLRICKMREINQVICVKPVDSIYSRTSTKMQRSRSPPRPRGKSCYSQTARPIKTNMLEITWIYLTWQARQTTQTMARIYWKPISCKMSKVFPLTVTYWMM